MIDCLNFPPEKPDCPDLLNRLDRRDTSLWSDDPDVRRSIAERLGWLDAGAFMDRESAGINRFAAQIRSEGYQQVVLLGMGGSSLAPEVYAALFGAGSGALTVVDSTAPAYVEQVTADRRGVPTLFIVSSKSGTTAETAALEAHFFDWARGHSDRPGKHFAAITDPGSPLQSLALERGYREVFENPADIGGRFSALSFFGLVPAALVGVDLQALRAGVPDTLTGSALAGDACRLGLALGHLARRGQNKLILHFSPSLAPVAAWVEQLVDESTGKQDQGIVVIPAEGAPNDRDVGDDRVFIIVDRDGDGMDTAGAAALAEAGHPVARWRLPGIEHIGAEFFRWEIATAMAGRHLGLNPFDEPDVSDSKAKTRALLESPGEDAGGAAPQSAADLQRLLQEAGHGDYIAILAYLPPTATNRRWLDTWSASLARHTGLPCCVGFGPRYLHSSGQLHKGGPNQGLFIVLTGGDDSDLPIPGQSYGFRRLIDAQARGDLRVLSERGRRTVHLQIGDEADLETLVRSSP